MPMIDVKRRQIRSAILKQMYEQLLQSEGMGALFDEGAIDGCDREDVQYELRRLEGEGFTDGKHFKRITARGMEYLQDLGVETLLDGDLRQRTLATLYETDRQQGPHERVSAEELAEALSVSASEITAVLHYLDDSGLIEVLHTMGNSFLSVNINTRGLAKHEAIQAGDGRWASSTTSPTDGHEFVFGPNEEAEAARLLRDVTEVARTEILVVDPYARAGIISKLQYVPGGVGVKVLTSDRMGTENYAAERERYPNLDIEIRALPKGRLQFHDRYIIVDSKDAWAWGHSFHDAGKTKHTVGQIRPVNRDRVMTDFHLKWSTGQVLA